MAEQIPTAPPLPGSQAATHPRASAVPSQLEPVMQSASADDITLAPLNLDTAQTDAAIDDIVAQEADEVLAAEDAGIAQANAEAEAAVPDQARRRGHPIFWFFVALLAIIAAFTAYVLMNPDLPFTA